MAKASREYAKALYNSLTSNEDKSKTLSLLNGLSLSLADDSKLMDQIKSKALSVESTKKTMNALLENLKAPTIVLNFFNLLADKGRMEILPELAAEYEILADAENEVLRGVVKSALLLNEEKRQELEEKFSKKMNKKVILAYEKDAKVVAGVKVEIGAFTYDDTIQTHIKKIKENLNRSWS